MSKLIVLETCQLLLTHLLCRSSSLPSSLDSWAGFCSANAALLLQHGYYFPHAATTEILQELSEDWGSWPYISDNNSDSNNKNV